MFLSCYNCFVDFEAVDDDVMFCEECKYTPTVESIYHFLDLDGDEGSRFYCGIPYSPEIPHTTLNSQVRCTGCRNKRNELGKAYREARNGF